MRIRGFITIILAMGLGWQSVSAQHPDDVGYRGMVVSANPTASRFGYNILRRGGNAIDAAIATGFALAVTTPRAGNIGGGGFMVIRLADGATTAIDFREKAPLKAHRNMYLDETGEVVPDLSETGILSVGVPGSVGGYGYAHENYGTMPWDALLLESANLAESGFAVTYGFYSDLAASKDRIDTFEETRRIFYPNNATPRINRLFRQPELAATLRRIMEAGPDEFYTGRTAQLLVQTMRKHGGLITLDDLARYEAVERPTIVFDYRGHRVISMPPPSSGGIILAEIMNMWEQVDFSRLEWHSAEHIHAMVEAEKRAYADRTHYLGDPDFVEMPVDKLISDGYAQQRFSDFNSRWATDSRDVGLEVAPRRYESEETTHFAVVDRWGNAVAVTTTLNRSFGSGMVVEGAGFFLNDEMDDFSSKPGSANHYGLVGSEANAIAPEKRMLSSMTPTIVTRNDSLVMIVGSPGGSKIITTVAQIISNVIDFNMTMKEAVMASRIHHQWLPDIIQYEPRSISLETRQRLARMGHKMKALAGYMGSAHSIAFDPRTGWYFGAADGRRENGAMGY